MSHNRTKRLLAAAAANPELSFVEVLAAKGLPDSDPEVVEAEVRARLRDIAEAIDPAVVEPLYRVIQARLVGRLTRDEAAGAAALLRALDGDGLQQLRQLCSEALAAVDDDRLRLKVRIAGDLLTPLSVIVVRGQDLLPLTFFASCRRLFKLLRDSGLVTEETSATFGETFISDGSVDTRPLEGITIERPTATALLRIVA